MIFRLLPFILTLFLVSCGTDNAVQPQRMSDIIQPQFPVSNQWYLSEWVWNIDGDDPHWQASYLNDGVVGGVFDLRSLTLQGTAGKIPGDTQCCLFFETLDTLLRPQIVRDDRLLILAGDFNPDDVAFNIPFIQSAIGIPFPILATSFAGIVKEIATLHSDPSGLTAMKPIMPRNGRVYTVNIGTTRIFTDREAINSIAFSKTVLTHRLDYDLAKARTADDLHLRMAGFWELEYGFDIRSDEQKMDGDTRPETTLTEDWDCANADSLDCDLTWDEHVGDIDIVSNQAQGKSVSASNDQAAKAESDLSSDDHIATTTAVCITNNDNAKPGISVRNNTSVETEYWARFRCGASTTIDIRKYVTGTETTLLSTTGIDWPTTLIMSLEIDGSDLELIVDGSTFNTTDSAITGNTRCGIRADVGGILDGADDVAWHEWDCADLSVGEVEQHRTQIIE